MTDKAASSRCWRAVDLFIYCYLMLVGFALVLLSIGMKHLVGTVITGLIGFSVMYSAIRFGALAKAAHDGI